MTLLHRMATSTRSFSARSCHRRAYTTVSWFDQQAKKHLPVKPKKIAVAVSGGSDSLALSLLAQSWARSVGGVEVAAFTVDHALRDDSGQEADLTCQRLQQLGISCQKLVVQWPNNERPPKNRWQPLARMARYRLLTDACLAADMNALLTGHHLEDQAETFLLRLSRQSGLAGLVGIRPVSKYVGGKVQEKLHLWRPLLELTKDQLRQVCHEHKVEWIDDPSNNDSIFRRVRVRQAQTFLTERGCSPSDITALSTHLWHLDTRCHTIVDAFLHHTSALMANGTRRMHGPSLHALPPVLKRAVVTRLWALHSTGRRRVISQGGLESIIYRLGTFVEGTTTVGQHNEVRLTLKEVPLEFYIMRSDLLRSWRDKARHRWESRS